MCILSRLRGPSPSPGVPSGHKMSQGPPMFSTAGPFIPPPVSTNNSSLSDKLKLGFSSGLHPHEVKREAEPYLRPSLASAPSLVTASSHSGEQCTFFPLHVHYMYHVYVLLFISLCTTTMSFLPQFHPWCNNPWLICPCIDNVGDLLHGWKLFTPLSPDVVPPCLPNWWVMAPLYWHLHK